MKKRNLILLILVQLVLIGCIKKIVYHEFYPHIINIKEYSDKSLCLYSWERALYKVDSVGDIIWEKSISEISNNRKNYCLELYYNVDSTLTNYAGFFLAIDTTENAKLNFGLLDQNGNNLEQKKEIEFDGTCINDMIFLNNEQWVIASMNAIYIYDKTKQTLSKIYELEYNNGQIVAISNIDNENFIVSAEKNNKNVDTTYILRLNSKGNIIWRKYFDASYYQLKRLQDNIFILGSQCNINSQKDICLVFIDKNGNEINKISTELNSGEEIKTILFDKLNCIYLIGHRWDSQSQMSSGLIIKLSSRGEKLFTRTYGYKKDKQFQSGLILSDSTLIIGGRCELETNIKNQRQDILVKLDLNGNIIWEKAIKLKSEY